VGSIIIGLVGFAAPNWGNKVNLERLAIVPVLLMMVSSLLVLISQNWRRVILALAIQYVGVFWLIALSWPVELAVIKLVVGWVAGAMLGASPPADFLDEQFSSLSGWLFRILAAVLVWILVYTSTPLLANWIPAKPTILWGGLILVAMGLLQLGMTTHPLRVVLGLLTLLSGFEILYATVEVSVLVTGLLAMINLGMALVGSYLVNVESMEQTP
jgi:hypothetical protein